MLGKPRSALLAALLLVPATIAWTGMKSGLTLEPRSRLWIDGTSTVRSFTCKAAVLEAEIQTVAPAAVRAVLAGEKAVGGVDVRIPTQRLDCANGKMNDHMLKALKATEHGTITFRLDSYDLAVAGDTTQVTLNGELTLAGTTKPITVVARASGQDGDVLRVAGSYELRMTEFGVKPPSLMLGTMKVHDKVRVGFELYLKDGPVAVSSALPTN